MSANYRARKLSAPGTHTKEELDRIRTVQRDCCNVCTAVLGGGGHVDHIEPLSRGGCNCAFNLQLLCQSCNQRKFNRMPDEFARLTVGIELEM